MSFFYLQCRLYAMNQIRELLSAHKEKTDPVTLRFTQTLSTLLCSAHLCLMAGCFNLGLLHGHQGAAMKLPRLSHYWVGVFIHNHSA